MTTEQHPQNVRALRRRSAALMLAGQTFFIAVTMLHPGGDANHHDAIFRTYAQDQSWIAVHLGQFAAITLLLTGMLGVFSAVKQTTGLGGLIRQLGSAATLTALALFGALQAVDGVALKHAVDFLAKAPDTEKAARFATAETLRWLEWGMRSYHDFALGLALFSGAASFALDDHWPLAWCAALAGAAYFVQAWLVGATGFSAAHSMAIVIGWVLNLAWMALLLAISRDGRAGGDSATG